LLDENVRIELAEFLTLELITEHPERIREYGLKIHRTYHAGFAHGRNHPIGFFRRKRQRLLAENMAAAFRSHQYLLAVKRRVSGDNGDLGADPLKEFLRAPVAREAVICGVTPSFDHGGLRLRQVGSPGHQK